MAARALWHRSTHLSCSTLQLGTRECPHSQFQLQHRFPLLPTLKCAPTWLQPSLAGLCGSPLPPVHASAARLIEIVYLLHTTDSLPFPTSSIPQQTLRCPHYLHLHRPPPLQPCPSQLPHLFLSPALVRPMGQLFTGRSKPGCLRQSPGTYSSALWECMHHAKQRAEPAYPLAQPFHWASLGEALRTLCPYGRRLLSCASFSSLLTPTRELPSLQPHLFL